MRKHSHKTHMCTQGRHISHNHVVFLGDYMKCKTQVAAYGHRTFALIPSIVTLPAPTPEALRFLNFLRNFWSETDRVSLKNWSFPG